MQLLEVGTNSELKKAFLQLPVRLYKDNAYWIRPLDNDIEKIFDPTKNELFETGQCIRWILKDTNNLVIGRVAAFYTNQTDHDDNDQPTGGMGFFECIEDKNAAFLLFDNCKKWLSEKGIEAMDGPINFGDRNSWWGLLIDGYDKEPIYTMDYHLPYYRVFFEEYGFQEYFKQFTYSRAVSEKKANTNPLIKRLAERVFDDSTYTFEYIKMNNWEKYAEDFRIIYNKGWVNHAGTKEMTKEKAQNLFKTMKPVIEEDLILFAYHQQKPIGFFIALPELNQIFKHVNGKLDLIGKLKFLYHKVMKTNKKMFGVVFGVVPEYQNKGIESAMILGFGKVSSQDNFRYETTELNWIGDFNPTMMRVCNLLDAKIIKTHITYRYLFDRTKEFKRYPIIGAKNKA